MGNQVPLTQTDVAEKAGVSRKAVAFALSSDPLLNRKLRPETRQRILSAVEELGYVPHNAARRLARARSSGAGGSFDHVGLIYLVASTDLDMTCLAMMSGAEQELSRFHASLTFMRVSQSEDWDKVDRLVRGSGVDSWLLYGAVTDDVVDRMQAGNLPYVIIGDHRCTRPVPAVNIDNFAVGRLGAEHLADLGHRRVAYWGSNMSFVYRRETLAGFTATARERGLDPDPRLIVNHTTLIDGKAPYAQQAELMLRWLDSTGDARPTAIFLPEFDFTDNMHRVLQQAKINVPGEISILGCERASPATMAQGLTRIEMSISEVGRQGAALLRKLTTGEQTSSAEMRLAPALITGWSTARPHHER